MVSDLPVKVRSWGLPIQSYSTLARGDPASASSNVNVLERRASQFAGRNPSAKYVCGRRLIPGASSKVAIDGRLEAVLGAENPPYGILEQGNPEQVRRAPLPYLAPVISDDHDPCSTPSRSLKCLRIFASVDNQSLKRRVRFGTLSLWSLA